VGLKSDGTVVAVGYSYAREEGEKGPCEVDGWADITQVAGGGFYTVGFKSDGTVVAAGRNDRGQCDVGNWTDIVQVAAGSSHTVGFKSDGAVVAVGNEVPEGLKTKTGRNIQADYDSHTGIDCTDARASTNDDKVTVVIGMFRHSQAPVSSSCWSVFAVPSLKKKEGTMIVTSSAVEKL
jgi:alpha-tubulin suppressor-like RCC1 family protein